jgi:hypothetical protein
MTQENLLAENAELKRKLAEAKKACPCSGGGHTLTKCPYFRAVAAERELAGYKHMLSMAHEQRDINRDRAEQSERKCAELSEALQKASFELRHNVHLGADAQIALADILDAALASQPAPEGKPSGRCCGNGNFFDGHHCQKQPHPKPTPEAP